MPSRLHSVLNHPTEVMGPEKDDFAIRQNRPHTVWTYAYNQWIELGVITNEVYMPPNPPDLRPEIDALRAEVFELRAMIAQTQLKEIVEEHV